MNAAYREKVSRIVKLPSAGQWEPSTTMLISTEIDIFGSDTYLPLTRFDRALDANHAQPGFQPYEKMMSGAYLGELARLISLELIFHAELFNGHMPELFSKP